MSINRKVSTKGRSVRQAVAEYEKRQRRMIESTEKGEAKPTFLSIHKVSIGALFGYNPAFIDEWLQLRKAGVIYTARAKLWSKINTTHKKYAPKPVFTKQKSAPPESAFSGHLPFVKEFTKYESHKFEHMSTDTEEFEKFTFKMPNKPVETVYLTFERQSIRSILAKIANGEYELLDFSNHHAPGDLNSNRYMIIKDQSGESFYINFADDGARPNSLATWSDTPIRSFRKFTEGFTHPNISAPTREQEQWNLIKWLKQQHIDDEFKLLRCKYDQENGFNPRRDVDYNPNIVCDDEGNPIRGDVDLQNAILPDNLPAIAFQLIDVKNCDELIIELRKLLKLLQLNSLATATHTPYIRIFKNAITFLTQVSKDPVLANTVLESIGQINLFNAGIVLGMQQKEILHGAEAASPLKPENILLTHIPDPSNSESFIVTHSEFEYLQLLHTNTALTKGKVLDFNPCWFVKYANQDPEIDWRRDISSDDAGADIEHVKHPCTNKADEEFNIHLWRLLFEKNLLQYKATHSAAEFREYTLVLKRNYEIMLKTKYSYQDGLIDTLHAGIKLAVEMIDTVNRTPKEMIGLQLSKIEKLSNQLIAKKLKQTIKPSTVEKNDPKL